MANKNLFASQRGATVPVADTVNLAGGRAYAMKDESALAQYVVTGTLNGTYYASADEQLDTVLKLAQSARPEFVAKVAVYGRQVAKMKDTPALLLAVLAARKETNLLESVFDRVIFNQKMLRNFVQILRSGKTGRKSFGTSVKRLIQTWLAKQEADQLFYQSVGQSPSLADIVKMVHPHPDSKTKEAFYGWLLGREYNKRNLPKLVKQFETFKESPSDSEVPAVDFRMLTALPLTTSQWSDIARSASWNTLRMNLNTFQRHGCFDDASLVEAVAQKLCNVEEVRKANAFPYQLLTAFQATEGSIPMKLSVALQQAMETATQNVPEFAGKVAVAVDTSGSMRSPITGNRPGATTKTNCVDVAALIAACVLRKNTDAEIIPFDTTVHHVKLNPLDSVMTNARKLALNGGGTNCASALADLNRRQWRGEAVIYVSDNESWYDPNRGATFGWSFGANRGTTMANEWATFKGRNKKAKLVCIDLTPNTTVQVVDSKEVLNIGGFSDNVFEVVKNFIDGDKQNFAQVIEEAVEL
jgi:60 kDa SS-A/Ro ribonucleoprotein